MKKSLMLLALFCWSLISYAQEKRVKNEKDPELAITQHRVTANGKVINYTATTGHLILRDEEGYSRAKVFFIAYTKEGENPEKRPVTYTFNGGPGSSSVWLHMGGLGPKRIVMTDEGEAIRPPYQLIDNEYTWLDKTDLVFIDPIETGFSRPAEGVDKKEFTGYNEDIRLVGDFIRLYTSKYGRWGSPKFLAGESYGTTRAVGLSGYLQDRHGMYLNGLLLVSSILNFQTVDFEEGNELPYPLHLPTYAAIAWYHGKLDKAKFPDLKTLLPQVEKFALEEYTVALMKGDKLEKQKYEEVKDKLHLYTGLSKTYLDQTRLRIEIGRFVKELRRDEGITVGRLDGRITSSDLDDAGEYYEFDPSYSKAILGPYTTALNDHLKRNLKFSMDDWPYEILTGRVRPWNYSNVQNKYLDNSQVLRKAIHKNPHLQVLVCNGYYDLATPYFATHYTFDHLFLNPEYKDNIRMTYYEAGHMMYIHKPSLIQFTQDVRKFYEEVIK